MNTISRKEITRDVILLVVGLVIVLISHGAGLTLFESTVLFFLWLIFGTLQGLVADLNNLLKK